MGNVSVKRKKDVFFLQGEVFIYLTNPLMGDPDFFHD